MAPRKRKGMILMRILSKNEWQDGFLDYWRSEDDYRIQVKRLVNLEQLEDVYFVRRRSPRMVLNYVRELGIIEVARKVISRSKERRRNEKFISAGLGRVVESPATGRYALGQDVVFVAPCHPACVERLVLPEVLLGESAWLEDTDDTDHVQYIPLKSDQAASDCWWNSIQGWTEDCGGELPAELVTSLLTSARQALAHLDWRSARSLAASPATRVVERTAGELGAVAERGKRRAVLFGLGNYAKTTVVPNMASYCDLAAIHEVDPVAMPRRRNSRVLWDTCPHLRPDDPCDICLVAGHHHTHAPLAIAAMRRGAAAVVEKPVVTSQHQLAELLDELRQGRGRLFSCFQKRYHPFNRRAYVDLGVDPGEPISYHCIVYEVPLPQLHWYRWPASGSRILSNGCHWIDHFLHLNPGGQVVSYHLTVDPGETVNCSVSLDSGAMFTMVLTDFGSSRLGVRDYIELRTRDATVAITDSRDYRAETSRRITGRSRVHRYAATRAMYAEIGRKILAGEDGDSIESVERSAGLILALEDVFQSQCCSDETTVGRPMGRYRAHVAKSQGMGPIE